MALQSGVSLYAASTEIFTRLPSRPSHRGSPYQNAHQISRRTDVNSTHPSAGGPSPPAWSSQKELPMSLCWNYQFFPLSNQTVPNQRVDYSWYICNGMKIPSLFGRIYKEILPRFFSLHMNAGSWLLRQSTAIFMNCPTPVPLSFFPFYCIFMLWLLLATPLRAFIPLIILIKVNQFSHYVFKISIPCFQICTCKKPLSIMWSAAVDSRHQTQVSHLLDAQAPDPCTYPSF